jgi:hypothetical protein
MRSSGARIRAGLALLVLYVVGGAWGLPMLDAVVYHTFDSRAASTPHVEPDGGCGHADGCSLGVGTPPAQAALAYLPAERIGLTLPAAPAALPESPPLSPLHPLQNPRAPPVQPS